MKRCSMMYDVIIIMHASNANAFLRHVCFPQNIQYNCLLLAFSLMVVFISKGFHRLKGNVSRQEVASKQLVFSYSTTLFLWFLA